MKRRRQEHVLIGVDVQSISEVERSVQEFGDRYLKRVYTQYEIDSCMGSGRVFAAGLAARFAAKEALIKLLDAGGDGPPFWKSIEVRLTPSGRPVFDLHDLTQKMAKKKGVRELSLSLSHDGDTAMAAVVGAGLRQKGLQ